jgi:flagellar hook assembly protein FlgD
MAHHFCVIEIDGGEMHFSVITAQDSLIDSLTIALPDAGIPGREGAVADRAFDLGAAAPNPFHQYTEIELSLSREAEVTVAIYDVDGRVVRNLIDSRLGPGKYLVEWDGMDDVGFAAPPGIYFCRVEGDRNVDVGKLVLLK